MLLYDVEASDDVSDVHAGVGDKVRVDIDDDSGHSDSLHSVDKSDSDGPRKKQRYLEFNTNVDISYPTFKDYYGGHLLAYVGMDVDDSLYPLAFAVVEVESESSWCLFLERLMADFELNNFHHISFMTDRQKMILEARDKPIITLLESIRSTLMQRIAKKRAEAEKFTDIPCIHAISVILLLEEKPESYVDPCYSVSTQMAIYSHFSTPVRGENQWTHEHGMDENVLPSILRRPPGRPHEKRRRKVDEVPSQGSKGVKISCTKYGGSGHNTRTCKGLFMKIPEPI
ncbi:hypothetical protein V6N13_133644 [Hibiscus sabdariffa]